MRPSELTIGDFEPGRLFLTSKVRLHCDLLMASLLREHYANLFLTSKVRLYCDSYGLYWRAKCYIAFS